MEKETSMKITISKIYGSFKTTIPKEIREVFNLKDGDGLLYRFEDDLSEIRALIAEWGEIVILLPNKNKSKKDRFKELL